MRRPAGIQTALVVSLAVVMALSGVVLAGLLFSHHEAQTRELLGRVLLQEARNPRPIGESAIPGTEWWTVTANHGVAPRNASAGRIDPASRELGERVLEEAQVLLQPGRLWGQVRFAAPVEEGAVVGRLPRTYSLETRWSGAQVVFWVLVGDVLIFTLLGVYLVRRRVARPLEQLVFAVRQLTDGEVRPRVPIDGVREIAELGSAWNEMAEALAERSDATEKALLELRRTNAELKRTRAGLDRAERLASVGRLAAGVAHEVGNPIGAMLALVDLAGRDPGLSEDGRGHLERVAREGDRVRRILRQLLDFSRPPRTVPEPVSMHLLVQEAVALVTAQPRFSRVEVTREEKGSVPLAFADTGSVSQILINLFLNAGDALLETHDPKIRVLLEPWVLDSREGEQPEEALRAGRPPNAVRCCVDDNGSGVRDEDADRLFDPFFTTKPPGEGTGLGLANAARLAEELGGVLQWQAGTENFCTRFALVLPAHEAELPVGAARSAQTASQCEEDCEPLRAQKP